MTEFNPATMHPASIILQENINNTINLSDYILIFLIICIVLFIILQNIRNKL